MGDSWDQTIFQNGALLPNSAVITCEQEDGLSISQRFGSITAELVKNHEEDMDSG